MDEEIESWTTRRISVLVPDISQGEPTVDSRHIASPRGGTLFLDEIFKVVPWLSCAR